MNNTPKSTPGPWRMEMDAQGCLVLNDERDGRYVKTIALVPGQASVPDACLIAAAPDLLAALQELRAYADLKLQGHRQDYPEHHCMVQTALRMIELADKAIAKATQ